MIGYSNTCINKWNKKIVYAPNGIGKTTSSKKLYEDIKTADGKVKLFTRRELEDLIAEAPDGIYMGRNASKSARRDKIATILDNQTCLKEINDNVRNSQSFKEAKEKSFYISLNKFTNFTELKKIAKVDKNRTTLINFNDENVLNELDCNLDSKIYNEIETIDLKKKGVMNQIDPVDSLEQEYIDYLIALYIVSKSKSLKICLLCGHKYRSHKALEEAIEEKINSTKVLLVDSDEKRAISLARKIIMSVNKSNSSLLKNTFASSDISSFAKCIKVIKMYKSICISVNYYYSKKITSNNVEDENIGDLIIEYHKLEKDIETVNKKNVERFNKFLAKEVNDLCFSNDSPYQIRGMEKNVGIVLYKNNKKAKEKLYDVLSESEFKRLCLIALKAQIKFGDIETLILDDPIDSYDDYNKMQACYYISKMLKMTKIKNWYILTNDLEALFYLTEFIKCDSIFYLQDFSTSLGGTNGLVEISCTKDQVLNYLRMNDIFYLSYFAGRKYSTSPAFDYDLLCTGLLLTLRNYKVEIFDKFKSTKVIEEISIQCPNCAKKIKTIKENAAFNTEVDSKIVSCAEHYFEDPTMVQTDSLRLTTAEVAEVYCCLAKGKANTYPASILKLNTTPFISYRATTCLKNVFVNQTWEEIVNYLFKKISLISHVKFELERKLDVLCRSTFTTTEYLSFKSKNGLGKMIGEANAILSRNPTYSIGSKLDKISNVYEKYRVLFNSIDHGLTRIITPYLSASIKEIEGFYNDVSKI